MKRILATWGASLAMLLTVLGAAPAQAADGPTPGIVAPPTTTALSYDYLGCTDVYHTVVSPNKKMKLRTCIHRGWTRDVLSGAVVTKRLRAYTDATCKTDLVNGNWNSGRLYPCSFEAYVFLQESDVAYPDTGDPYWKVTSTGNDGFAGFPKPENDSRRKWWAPAGICTGAMLYTADVHWYNIGLDGSRQHDYVRETKSLDFSC